jgi:acetylornithine deacetylase
MKTINLARNLLKIPSPSGDESKLGNYIVKRLKKNFKIKIQKVNNNFNILAYVGDPNLILNIHLDTVPNQLNVKEDKNYLYGRGACDAKGPLACMIVAAEQAIEQKLTNFGLLFDVEEETNFSGIKKALSLVNPKYVIIGEPTNFKVINKQKGLLGVKIICKGKAAHGSTPEKGISAINRLIEILSKLNKINFPSGTTLNVGKIQGGSSINTVPNYAEAIIELRTTVNNTNILELLDTIPKKILYSYNPINTKTFIKNYKEISVSYFTEMYFWNKKAKTIVLGPGNPSLAHSDKEKIKKSDLKKATKIYLKIISTLSLNSKKNISKKAKNGYSKRI